MAQLEGTGLLADYLDCINIVDDTDPHLTKIKAVEVARREIPGGVPTFWYGYGFEWGLTRADNANC